MEPYTVYLDKNDIGLLQEVARRMRLPPHVLARSLLLRMLEQERETAAGTNNHEEGGA